MEKNKFDEEILKEFKELNFNLRQINSNLDHIRIQMQIKNQHFK